MVFALCECYVLLLSWVCRRVVALDPDDDDVMTTSNGAWVNFAIIVGLSGGLLLLLFMLLKVGHSRCFNQYKTCLPKKCM